MDELSGWDDTLHDLLEGIYPETRVIFICGSAISGRGIFTRLLNNTLVCHQTGVGDEVAFLDLDPSRPEMSLPGHISLFVPKGPYYRPSFARQNADFRQGQMILSQSVGATAPRTAVDHYLRCVRTLLEKTQESRYKIICGPDIPLQSGGQLFGTLISMTGATDVVFMSEKTKAAFKGAVLGLTIRRYVANSNSVMHQLLSPQVEEEKRSLQSYFHSAKKLRPAPLMSQIPYELSYQEGKGDFLAVLVPGEVTCMPPNWLATLLNGSIVTIILLDEDYPLKGREIKRSGHDGIPYFAATDDGEVENLDPRHSRSAGLGLVRGIDVENKQLHVITPEMLGRMSSSRIVLELGGYDATWAYTEDARYCSLPGIEETGGLRDAPYVESRRNWKGRKESILSISTVA
jgi:polynucleotide 5'-hydroxyl-kinase GRC3/NOL9